VGVIDADVGLNGGDLRAAEKTWQLLQQVGGRAGRENIKGRVYIQSFLPEHPVMQALAEGNRDAMYDLLLKERKEGGWPPFGTLAAFIMFSDDTKALQQATTLLLKAMPVHPHITVLGPAPAPIAKIRGAYRWRWLVKGEKNTPLQSFINRWLTRVVLPKGVRLDVDINPQSFL
jgi:primosomal protein N' (replication factor Y) (superfamily II helicase)